MMNSCLLILRMEYPFIDGVSTLAICFGDAEPLDGWRRECRWRSLSEDGVADLHHEMLKIENM